MPLLYEYTITIRGRMPAENHPVVVERLRNGLCFNFPMHESIDELLIDAKPLNESFEDMRRRFSDR